MGAGQAPAGPRGAETGAGDQLSRRLGSDHLSRALDPDIGRDRQGAADDFYGRNPGRSFERRGEVGGRGGGGGREQNLESSSQGPSRLRGGDREVAGRAARLTRERGRARRLLAG